MLPTLSSPHFNDLQPPEALECTIYKGMTSSLRALHSRLIHLETLLPVMGMKTSAYKSSVGPSHGDPLFKPPVEFISSREETLRSKQS